MPSTKEIATKKAKKARNWVGYCPACNWATGKLYQECAEKAAALKRERALLDGSVLVDGKRQKAARTLMIKQHLTVAGILPVSER